MTCSLALKVVDQLPMPYLLISKTEYVIKEKSRNETNLQKNEIKKNYRKPVRTTEYKFHLELVRQKNTLFRLKSDFIIEKVSDTRFLLLRKNDDKNIPNRQVEKSKRTHKN